MSCFLASGSRLHLHLTSAALCEWKLPRISLKIQKTYGHLGLSPQALVYYIYRWRGGGFKIGNVISVKNLNSSTSLRSRHTFCLTVSARAKSSVEEITEV